MQKTTAGGYIDADALPFTAEELRRAFLLGGVSEPDAGRVAAEIAALPALTAEMAREAEAARARGSTNPEEISPPSWCVGEEIFAILWCVPDLTGRVEAHMERRWSEWRAAWTASELRVRGLPIQEPAPPEVVALVRRKLAPYRAAWTRRKRRLAVRLAAMRSSDSE